jgi:hypothetical protein
MTLHAIRIQIWLNKMQMDAKNIESLLMMLKK